MLGIALCRYISEWGLFCFIDAKMLKYELTVEDGKRLAKKYSRVLMRNPQTLNLNTHYHQWRTTKPFHISPLPLPLPNLTASESTTSYSSYAIRLYYHPLPSKPPSFVENHSRPCFLESLIQRYSHLVLYIVTLHFLGWRYHQCKYGYWILKHQSTYFFANLCWFNYS